MNVLVENTNVVKNNPKTGFVEIKDENFAWGFNVLIEFSDTVLVENNYSGLFFNDGQAEIKFDGAHLCENSFDGLILNKLECIKTISLNKEEFKNDPFNLMKID